MGTEFTRVAALAACVGFALTGGAAENLLVNADLRGDNGIGMPLGWASSMYPPEIGVGGGIEGRAQADGSFEVVTHGGSSRYFLSQSGLTLLPDGEYDLSCDVRTAGLRGGQARLFVRNTEWKSESQGFAVPDDTKGEWVRLTKRIRAEQTKRPSEYVFVIEESVGSNGTARIEVRALSLVPAGDSERAVSKGLSVAMRERLPARIVPVDPLLANVRADDARMTFYWAGAPSCGISRCQLVSRFKGDQYKTPVFARFDEKGYATVRYGRIRPSEYEIETTVIDDATNHLAKNEYRITVRRPEKSVTFGKRLNNFVAELVSAPLADGDVKFERAEQGWTWISFDGDIGDARGYLDGCAEPVVMRREGEPTVETQRYLAGGPHVLRVVGAKGGRLRIHAVKTLWGPELKDFAASRSELNGMEIYRYALPFARTFGLISTFNTVSGARNILTDPYGFSAGHYLGRGIRLGLSCTFWPSDKDRLDAEASYRHLAGSVWPGYPCVTVNENLVRAEALASVNFSEAVWRLSAEQPRTAINVWYADSSWGAVFDKPRQHVSEISSVVNSGGGTGLLVPELYIPVTPTRAGLTQYVDSAAAFIGEAQRMVPASRGKIVLYGASYIMLGDFCNYYSPETDIKAQYAALMHAYATDPRFAGCAGVGFGGLPRGEEEFRRWGVRLIRYYGLEGGTENLADKAGFRWNPGFVRNPDFTEGFDGWTVNAAETDGLCTERIKHFGRKVEQRVSPTLGYGDTMATFRHSDKGPNVLSQKLTGLEPGRHYSLLCAVVDRNSMTNTARYTWSKLPPFAFRVELNGATEVCELRSIIAQRCADDSAPQGLRNRTVLRILRYVFRADGSEATLSFTDRHEDGSGAPGAWLSMNYVVFRPYYAEDGEEGVRRVISALNGETAGVDAGIRK